MTTNDCPKCRSRMEEGFGLDADANHQLSTTKWIEGRPEKSFFSGVKTKGKRQFPITLYRCTRCGFLEAYARAEG